MLFKRFCNMFAEIMWVWRPIPRFLQFLFMQIDFAALQPILVYWSIGLAAYSLMAQLLVAVSIFHMKKNSGCLSSAMSCCCFLFYVVTYLPRAKSHSTAAIRPEGCIKPLVVEPTTASSLQPPAASTRRSSDRRRCVI